MDDKQLKALITILDQRLDIALTAQDERLEHRFQKLESQLDYLIDAIDTEEVERRAANSQTDRQLDNHERRIHKLELATN